MSDMLEGMPQPASLKEMYAIITKKIAETDEVLDLAGDQKAAGKVKMKNLLLEETKPEWEATATDAVDKIGSIGDERQRLGFFLGLIDALSEAFEESLDAYIEELVKNQPKVAESDKPSKEQQEKLLDQRKSLWNNAKTLREMALTFSQGVPEDFPEIKKRTARSGPRGERAISQFTWSLNGEPLSGDDNRLIAIAKKFETQIPLQSVTTKNRKGEETTKELSTITSLRHLIAKANGLEDLTDPPDTLNYRFSDGTVLIGTKLQGDSSVEEDEDEEADESEVEASTETPV